jgi:hypothetical protein
MINLCVALSFGMSYNFCYNKYTEELTMKKKLPMLLLITLVLAVFAGFINTMASSPAAGEKWIDESGNTSQPRNSRDVRNNANGFDTRDYTPVMFEGEVTLYAQNYGYESNDNYDIKLFILNNSGNYTQIGRLYGYGDNLRVEVFAGHSITLIFQRHQIENRFYSVELTGPFSTTYKKDFDGSNTGYTSGNIYVKYNSSTSSYIAPPMVSPAPIQSPAFITVTYNGSAIEFDQQPRNENGRTLVPVGAIFAAMGAVVNWDEATQTVTAERGNVTISLTIGSTTMLRNDVEVILDVPPTIVNDRTMVPARVVAESFGAVVSWDEDSRTVIITEDIEN